jgi:hypothetical protein
MRNAGLFTLLLFFVPIASYGQAATKSDNPGFASIEMQSGADYYGHIVRESPDTVFLQTQDGTSMELPRKSIESIDYNAAIIHNSYWAMGGVFGTPAGGNFVIASYGRHVGVRFSFGYWGDNLAGAEISLPINIYRSEHTSHDIALVAWASQIGSTETNYDWNTGAPYQYSVTKSFLGFGPAYQVNLSGFAGELGITFGSGDYGSPQIIFQLGYVHEFR